MSQCRKCCCKECCCKKCYPCYSPSYPCYPPYPTATDDGNQMLGGFTDFRPVTAEDIAIFNRAIGRVVGTTYVPILVSTQVVNGTNYIFIAQTSKVTSTGTIQGLARVKIYVDLQGAAQVISIEPC